MDFLHGQRRQNPAPVGCKAYQPARPGSGALSAVPDIVNNREGTLVQKYIPVPIVLRRRAGLAEARLGPR